MENIYHRNILDNLSEVHKRIDEACKTAGRDRSDVKLLLATKTVPAEKIRVALEAGENLVGENKVQELRDKHDALIAINFERHFIGHLQTNKIKDVLKYATCIQSLDRLKVAEEIDRRLQIEGRQLNVFVQVNTSYEESKFGISPEDAISFIKNVRQFETLNIVGLMTIGLLDVDKEKMRPSLSLLRQTRDLVLQEGVDGIEKLDLSMGMSLDLEAAIAEGANIVRVGSAIFGNRVLGKEIWNENEPS